jgi:transposase
MPHYAGLDISKKTTAICVLDDTGTPVDEVLVATDPKSLIGALRGKRRRYRHVGMEAGNRATWLLPHLLKAGLPAVLLETRHTHLALRARLNKTDRNDARGMAELLRSGSFRAVHVKSVENQRLKTLLTIRRTLIQKQVDIELSLRGILTQYGRALDAGRASKKYTQRIVRICKGDPDLGTLLDPLIVAHDVLGSQIANLTEQALAMALDDPVCKRLMTAPAVGPLTALEFRAAIDDPSRFGRSRSVGAHLGLTPRTYQSGESRREGRISRRGDLAARVALFNAARVLLFRMKRPCEIRAWGVALVEKKGKATVAVARRLAVLLHSMWKNETDYSWDAIASRHTQLS